jgi:hypothetical protein
VGGIIYSGARRGRFVDGSRRAERRSGILESADRGIGRCSLSAAASVAHAKGADVARKAGKRSAGNGYGVPVLWGANVGAGFAMFVPGVRGGEELGAKGKLETRNQKLERESRSSKLGNSGEKIPTLSDRSRKEWGTRKSDGSEDPPLQKREGPTCGRAFRLIGESGDGYLVEVEVAAWALAAS